MAINFDDLPEWAQEEIREAGGGIVQVIFAGNTLQVAGDTARYNGQLVVHGDASVSQEDESISLRDLPAWAREEIRGAGTGLKQITRNTDTLQIVSGRATFNGKQVSY